MQNIASVFFGPRGNFFLFFFSKEYEKRRPGFFKFNKLNALLDDKNFIGICWPKIYVSALGIHVCFTTDQNISYSKNLESRLPSLEKCLNMWPSRDLTLYGKINIL